MTSLQKLNDTIARIALDLHLYEKATEAILQATDCVNWTFMTFMVPAHVKAIQTAQVLADDVPEWKALLNSQGLEDVPADIFGSLCAASTQHHSL